ncbi:Histidine kinase-, DNA gyrase B-, and HSP90-like ATPase [Rubrobacter radiotolerans]|uniref:histidine kinase n=1 Tax=Rubrobacter radiotolerans TaxID=42256 RepID=A0A023X6L9_RUBRA|nr:ATP-binding protein [Rubrobacter radiotolerans]AHY47871.1 Histidine kinase-, DNA gyrase B-, and HSP90-like ATPase [Rubrobacter radiotolerans]MDX5892509.1 ATP-binding protein [Rubrobacter radiotolerans]SMC07800.1 Signal transduction histidine kinase [Rubrobacter radiotolerans DSM 5868]
MSLRKKLFATFAGLALMTLLVSGVTVWAMVQWNRTEEELQDHYQRSLILEDVRAQTLQAFLEVSEGLTGNDADAREDFEEALVPAERNFQRWMGLADTEGELREVETVRAAYDDAVAGSERAFDLIEDDRLDEAESLFDELEDTVYEEFQVVTREAAEADRLRREEIRTSVEDTRRTAQILLAVSSFGAISLVLLLAAFLASDLFTPLRELRNGLGSVRRGDRDIRLPEDRSDEIGELNEEFNRLVGALAVRERRGESEAARERGEGNGIASGSGNGLANGYAGGNGEAPAWVETPTRITLHRMISRMRRDLEGLDGSESEERRRKLSRDLRNLAHAVSRITEFSYPLDLHLTKTDIRETVYGVIQRFNGELIERSVSLEVDISPDVRKAVVDRLKLREALSELFRNALDALPERGGRIGVRSGLSRSPENEERLVVEVADDGVGAEQSLIDQSFERDLEEDYSGLSLVRAIIEQHGGDFSVESEPGEGTYARIEIPLRD